MTAPAEGARGTGYGHGAEIQDLLAHQARVAQALGGLFNALAAIEQRLLQVEAQLRVLVARAGGERVASQQTLEDLKGLAADLRAHPNGLTYDEIEALGPLRGVALDDVMRAGFERGVLVCTRDARGDVFHAKERDDDPG